MVRQAIPLAIATLLIVGGMLYQGKLTERWGDMNSELLAQFTENMKTVPSSFDSWSSEETPLSPEEFERTDCTAYVSRNYSNRNTAKQVSVYSVVGTARHVTIHSPDWCYVGAGLPWRANPSRISFRLMAKTMNSRRQHSARIRTKDSSDFESSGRIPKMELGTVLPRQRASSPANPLFAKSI